MAKTRKASRTRKPARKAAPKRKKAKKSARRPKPAKRVKKAARKARKPVRKARKPARKPARRSGRKPVRKAAKKKAARKPGRKAVRKKAAKKTATKKTATRKAVGRPAPPVTRKVPRLDRDRRQLAEPEETRSAPSSLGYSSGASAARSGQHEMHEARALHTEGGPVLTGGDIDASWQDAYAVGDEAPGGDNPTPDQDRVDDIGKALGVQYDDNEELKASDKITERDRHRWELDPASSDDYRDRRKDED